MLRGVEALVFDIQDVGARPYTYVSTMALGMQAAAEQGIPFVVLDRPNPITGTRVEGGVLDTAFATFVGMYPVPSRHGMTVGELEWRVAHFDRLAGTDRLRAAIVAETLPALLREWEDAAERFRAARAPYLLYR